MLRFLFWNIARSTDEDLVARAARSNEADVLILAECEIMPARLLEALNRDAPDYQYAPGQCERLRFFSNFDSGFLRPSYETARVSIRRLSLPGRDQVTLVGAHLPSKLHFSAGSQVFGCMELNQIIEEEETKAGHKRTILMGDLNMNPFEMGVAASGGLHAVMSRQVALRRSRTVQEQTYSFFYNPMWSHFGDRGAGPSGTYYYEKAEHLNYFWNIFDQVLLRPELLSGFQPDGVRIITSIEDLSLLDEDGIPDKEHGSDHLPVLLELNL